MSMAPDYSRRMYNESTIYGADANELFFWNDGLPWLSNFHFFLSVSHLLLLISAV